MKIIEQYKQMENFLQVTFDAMKTQEEIDAFVSALEKILQKDNAAYFPSNDSDYAIKKILNILNYFAPNAHGIIAAIKLVTLETTHHKLVEKIARAVKNNKSFELNDMDFIENGIVVKPKQLCDVFYVINTLSINISVLSIPSELLPAKIFDILKEFLIANKTLMTLNLSYYQLNKHSIDDFLAFYIENNLAIEILLHCSNDIIYQKLSYKLRYAHVDRVTVKLTTNDFFEDNHLITPKGLRSAFIMINRLPINLKVLTIPKELLLNEMLSIFIEFIKKNKTITTLNLFYCEFCENAISNLCDALKENYYIRDIFTNNIDKIFKDKIRDICLRNKKYHIYCHLISKYFHAAEQNINNNKCSTYLMTIIEQYIQKIIELTKHHFINNKLLNFRKRLTTLQYKNFMLINRNNTIALSPKKVATTTKLNNKPQVVKARL